MKRRIFRAILGAAIVAIGIWIWVVMFPGPERAIRLRLAELAKSASFGGNESPLAKLANSQRLAGFFTSDVEIDVDAPGRPKLTLNGRDSLAQAAMQVRSVYSGLQVEFLDINIILAPDKQSAEANLTLKGRLAGEKDMIVQELRMLLNKLEGTWKVKKVETVKTLSYDRS